MALEGGLAQPVLARGRLVQLLGILQALLEKAVLHVETSMRQPTM